LFFALRSGIATNINIANFAGRKGGVGKMNARPALAFAAAEFRAS
jgi:hypothetical protein